MNKHFFGMVTTKSSHEYTLLALRSFYTHTPLAPEDRLFLIDNDGDFEKEIAGNLPGLELIVNSVPKSFAANVNQVMARAIESRADLYFLNNDLIFTRGWLDGMRPDTGSILSPLSNREVPYAESVINPKTQAIARMFITNMSMTRADYIGKETALDAIADAHRQAFSGQLRVLALPFFCVKLPLPVLDALGHFDTGFGIGGGEDYDYCLRAYLGGFDVKYELSSYILHFYGKSTWSGVESDAARHEREQKFMSHFHQKWGAPLHDLLLREDASVLAEHIKTQEEAEPQKLRETIVKLMAGKQVPLRL